MTDLKPGIVWAEMHPALWMARMEAARLHREMTGREMVITSGRRATTPGGSSRHETGEAMDIRVWYFDTNEQQRDYARRLRILLGPDFDVVVEGSAALDPRYKNRAPHIHVEYDPKEWAEVVDDG